MPENVILDKSYSFALEVVKLYSHLRKEQKEYHLSAQIVRSGTSIGANIEEAMGASSRRDFKAKLDIAYKEARETLFWIRLLQDSDLLSQEHAGILIRDCRELLRLLTAIITTLKSNC